MFAATSEYKGLDNQNDNWNWNDNQNLTGRGSYYHFQLPWSLPKKRRTRN